MIGKVNFCDFASPSISKLSMASSLNAKKATAISIAGSGINSELDPMFTMCAGDVEIIATYRNFTEGTLFDING